MAEMNEAERIKELEDENKTLRQELEQKKGFLELYELPGDKKLFYAMNRKANEMADLLNSKNLTNVALDDPKDKTFDRMKVIWNDAASIATAVKTLGESAGITNDEAKDTQQRKYRLTPESISNVLGNTAGQIN